MKKLTAMLLALAMVLALASCGSNSSSAGSNSSANQSNTSSGDTSQEATTSASGEPVYGGTMTMYFNNLNTDYDPSAPDYENYMFWYERLFAIDWTQTDETFAVITQDNVSGQIADSWEWDPELMTFTVNIRDDIYFQTLPEEYDYYGGRNLTATDVKWSYDRLLGIGSGYDEPVSSMMDWKSTLSMIDSIETDGDYTVIFHFNTNSDVAVSNFMTAMVSIAGPEWDELTDEQRQDWHYACGTGPYIISDYIEGATMTLVKNENYYDYDERYPENKLPYLDQVILVKVDDNATLLAEFMAGQVDIIGNSWSVFSDSEASQIVDSMDQGTYFTWELPNTGRGLVLKQTCEPLTNLEVRKALQYAINLDEIATEYFGYEEWTLPTVMGQATGMSSYEEWDQELIDSYLTYDPELAKSMLEEAGYGDGFTLQYAYVDSGDTDLYLLVQQYLAAVGVTLELVPVSTHEELVAAETNLDNEYVTYAEQGTSSYTMAQQKWLSTGPEYALGGEDELDAMIQASMNATSLEEQVSLVKAFDQYIMENHYVLAIGPTEQITYFTSGKLSGYSGQNLYASWNASTILARVWSSTGA